MSNGAIMTIRPCRPRPIVSTRKTRSIAALMELKWTGKTLSDLSRLYDFLAPVSRPAAVRVVRSRRAAPARLLEHPIGEKLEEFEPCEVRRILVGQYEMRYEIRKSIIRAAVVATARVVEGRIELRLLERRLREAAQLA